MDALKFGKWQEQQVLVAVTGVILNVVFCCLREGHNIPTGGPCKGPGAGGQQGWSERSQGGLSERGQDQQVGSARLFGVARAVLLQAPRGQHGPQGADLGARFPQLWEIQAPTSPETPASLVMSFVNTIYCAIIVCPAPCWGALGHNIPGRTG